MTAILRSRPNPFRFLIARMLVRSRLSSLFFIRRRGYRLRFFPTSLSSSLWELGPDERLDDERLLRKLLRPGDTYIDVGANIGTLTIVGRQAVGETGRIISIEAHPRTFRYLIKNLELNNVGAELHNCAVGECEGSLTFSDVSSDDQNKILLADGRGITVQVWPLDNLIGGVQRVRLLKVDVEGFELQVLRGARQLLSRCDAVYFESWDVHADRYGYSVEELVDHFRKSSFEVFRVKGQRLHRINDVHQSPQCEDLLAIASNRRSEVLNCFL